jgi:type VI secretion system protein ImpH
MVVLDESERNALGRTTALGQSFTIGARVADRGGRFRTQLGPVSYDTLEGLMPGGAHHASLRQIVDQFTGGVLEAEIEVLLHDDATPRFRLGSERGGRLGVSTTLGRRGKGGGRMRFTLGEDASRVHPEFIPE